MATRQERARQMLLGMGIKSSADFTDFSLGPTAKNRSRNKVIVQMVIFEGSTLNAAGKVYGLSGERARNIALGSVRRLTGRYENAKNI